MEENKFSIMLGKISNLQMSISMISLTALLVLNTFEIIIRTTLNHSLIWIQDVSVMFMIWMIFFGFTKITYEKKDIVVDTFINKIKGKKHDVIVVVGDLILMTFLSVYSYYSVLLFISQIGSGTVTTGLPLTLNTGAVVINACTILLIYSNDFVISLKRLVRGNNIC